MEKMLVCDALDERDLLRKRINRAIDDVRLIGCKRIKDDKVGAVPVDKFKSNAESEYQSIVDTIDRYHRLDIAITMANASTEITTRSGKTMTRAAAIALRKSMKGNGIGSMGVDFDGMLLSVMEEQYDNVVDTMEQYKRVADTETEKYKTSFSGKDNKKLTEEDIKAIEKLTSDLYGEVIDPLGLKDKIKTKRDEYDTFTKELDSAIKVSNATTYVEF